MLGHVNKSFHSLIGTINMSQHFSSRLIATCWLTLAVCVLGLWCHPVPDKNNDTTKGSVLALKKVDDLGQLNDFADYPDMVTDFLRLSTTIPTVATSSKAFAVTTSSTLSPLTTIKTTIKPTTAKIPSDIDTAFEVATAKFFPSVAPTVMTTTEKHTTTTEKSTTTVRPTVPKLQTLSSVAATPLPFIEKLKKTNKPAPSNEIEPLTKPTVVAETSTNLPISSVPQQQKKLMSDAATMTQQSLNIINPLIEQQPALSDSIKQQVVSAVQRQPVVALNQPQQQQMAVSGAASIQQQPTNLVQIAATIPPRQQPNIAPMVLPISTQQQPMMQNPAKMPNPAQSAMQQQMMFQNPAVMQQMMMRNPAIQQQQFQMMLQNRPQLIQKMATTTVKPGVKQPVTPIMTLISNSVIGSNRRPVFFLGGNGTPTNLLPISALPQLLSPLVAATSRPI